MNQIRRRLLLSGTALCGMTALGTAAKAQGSYPKKTITLVVGFTPGGSTDFIARLIAEKLASALGQSVIVENRSGANGLIAANYVASAQPDGYTLFVPSMGLVTNPLLYTGKNADPVKDFTALSLLVKIPNLVVVNANMPNTLADVLDLARKRAENEALTVGIAGVAAPGQLASELLQREAKVKFQFIPYKGSAPALTDVMAGHVDMSLPTVEAAMAGIQSGKLRVLAVTGTERTPVFPDVPTLAELGFPQTSSGVGWYGLVGPAGLPREITNRVSEEVAKIVHTQDVRQKLSEVGMEPVGSGSADMSTFLTSEQKRWGSLVKETNITMPTL